RAVSRSGALTATSVVASVRVVTTDTHPVNAWSTCGLQDDRGRARCSSAATVRALPHPSRAVGADRKPADKEGVVRTSRSRDHVASLSDKLGQQEVNGTALRRRI